jgi:hypothetical protein
MENSDKFQEAARRADEYFAKIEEVLKERDMWRALYNSQASGHQNAQNLMMQQITTLVNMYKKETKKVPRLPPILDAVYQDWNAEHGTEAREARDERHSKDQSV